MALPPLIKQKFDGNRAPSKPGLPPLKPRITGKAITTAFNGNPVKEMTTVSEILLKKGDTVQLNVELNPKGVYRLASDVIPQKGGDLVLLEWDDPFDHPSACARHAWARVSTVEKVTP